MNLSDVDFEDKGDDLHLPDSLCDNPHGFASMSISILCQSGPKTGGKGPGLKPENAMVFGDVPTIGTL